MSPNPDDFNEDELEPPQWLDHDFFRKVLENSEKPTNRGIEIKNVKLTPASMKGDHYASVMFRATIEYECEGEEKIKPVIIKIMPEEEGQKKEMIGKTFIFETEVGMYTEVLPRIEKILRATGDNEIMMTACLYYALSPRKLIVFEDLVPLGYSVLRDRAANREEVEAAYRKLAKLHAVSMKLNMEEPDCFKNYNNSLMTMSHMLKTEMMAGGIRIFNELLAEIPSLRKYSPYFERVKDTLLSKSVSTFKEYEDAPQEHAYYVLCHGDFHLKNMMFKHNPSNGQMEDVMLLDFQMCFMGNISIDLMYSYYMLLDKEKRQQFPQYLHYYYTHLIETLKKIGYEGQVPKLSELYEERRKRIHVEIFWLVTFLAMWDAFKNGKPDVESLMSDIEVRKAVYRDKDFLDTVHIQLEEYLHAGFLEDL